MGDLGGEVILLKSLITSIFVNFSIESGKDHPKGPWRGGIIFSIISWTILSILLWSDWLILINLNRLILIKSIIISWLKHLSLAVSFFSLFSSIKYVFSVSNNRDEYLSNRVSKFLIVNSWSFVIFPSENLEEKRCKISFLSLYRE